jgi:HlyD family secretion protein
MRWPRPRYSIAGLMILVLAVGLTIAIVFEVRARKAYQNARLSREAAEYALKEFEEVFYPQDLATAQGQIALAQSDLERAIDRLKWSTKMREKGQLSQATTIADQLTQQQAEFELEQARIQLEVLEKYTKEKQRKMLSIDLEKARADEQAKLRVCQTERAWQRWRGGRD